MSMICIIIIMLDVFGSNFILFFFKLFRVVGANKLILLLFSNVSDFFMGHILLLTLLSLNYKYLGIFLIFYFCLFFEY